MCFQFVFAQKADTNLPYSKIPDPAESYAAGNVTSRMLDGLGYRFFWATEALRTEDLNFVPNQDSRNTLETIQHIFSLSRTIRNVALGLPNPRPEDFSGMGFEAYRAGALQNLAEASLALRDKGEAEIAELKMVFEGANSRTEFPFWNVLNGPIADAIYHTGQVVLLRRMSGNPMNPKVNVLTGVTGQ